MKGRGVMDGRARYGPRAPLSAASGACSAGGGGQGDSGGERGGAPALSWEHRADGVGVGMGAANVGRRGRPIKVRRQERGNLVRWCRAVEGGRHSRCQKATRWPQSRGCLPAPTARGAPRVCGEAVPPHPPRSGAGRLFAAPQRTRNAGEGWARRQLVGAAAPRCEGGERGRRAPPRCCARGRAPRLSSHIRNKRVGARVSGACERGHHR